MTLWTVALRAVCPWYSPSKNPRVGSHSLLQGIFQDLPGIKPGSSVLQADSLPCEPPGKPILCMIMYIYMRAVYIHESSIYVNDTFSVCPTLAFSCCAHKSNAHCNTNYSSCDYGFKVLQPLVSGGVKPFTRPNQTLREERDQDRGNAV